MSENFHPANCNDASCPCHNIMPGPPRPSTPPDLSDVLTGEAMAELLDVAQAVDGSHGPDDWHRGLGATMRARIVALLTPFLAQRAAARDRQIAEATQRGDDFRAAMLAAVLERDDGKARYDRLAAAAREVCEADEMIAMGAGDVLDAPQWDDIIDALRAALRPERGETP